jgi:hypothetical protein
MGYVPCSLTVSKCIAFCPNMTLEQMDHVAFFTASLRRCL